MIKVFWNLIILNLKVIVGFFRLGLFGAPMCRLTTSVITLVGMMVGMVSATAGACIILFFTQEPTIIPLGITLLSLGGVLIFIGLIMWTSEFLCDDCLGRAYNKVKKAPLKNAIKRREKLASRATTRTGSRLSQASLRTTSTNVSQVSQQYWLTSIIYVQFCLMFFENDKIEEKYKD